MSEPGYEGFADLTSALLGGGGAQDHKAFMAGATQAVSLESAMDAARMRRQKRMERDQIRAKLPPGPEGDLMASIMLGEMGSDFNAATSGIGHMQQNTARSRALDLPQPGAAGYDVHSTPDALVQALAIAGDKLPSASNVGLGSQLDAKLAVDQATVQARKEQAAASSAAALSHKATADAALARAEATRRGKGGKTPTGVQGEVDGSAPEPTNEHPQGHVEARKTASNGKNYVKIAGHWYEE